MAIFLIKLTGKGDGPDFSDLHQVSKDQEVIATSLKFYEAEQFVAKQIKDTDKYYVQFSDQPSRAISGLAMKRLQSIKETNK